MRRKRQRALEQEGAITDLQSRVATLELAALRQERRTTQLEGALEATGTVVYELDEVMRDPSLSRLDPEGPAAKLFVRLAGEMTYGSPVLIVRHRATERGQD